MLFLSPCNAEATCLLWTLKLTSDLYFTNIELESNCLELVNAWNRSSQGLSYFDDLVKESLRRKSSFVLCCLKHVKRECNKVAYCLYYNEMYWIEDVPIEVSSLIHHDVISLHE
ncbi:hypothetical protein RIF29_33498 [Crotalaria pallida]|uniref:RNase H type-1 domain-containing protein n=1 Tax=Crotalaria pallida TaxID=3830 RepID=A0AAN9E7V5_CROPI